MSIRTVPDPARVARAFDMAAYLPTEESQELRIHVVSRDGHLLGSGVLRGGEQAGFLRDQLDILGSFELLPAPAAQRRGCDVLLKQAAHDPMRFAPELVRVSKPSAPRDDSRRRHPA